MKISKRDIEALIKKEIQLEGQCIYLDQSPIYLSVNKGNLIITCAKWLDLMKLFLRGKKHIYFYSDGIEIKHPLIQFDAVKVLEDEIEITFK